MKNKTYMLYNSWDGQSYGWGDLGYISEIINANWDAKVKPNLRSVKAFTRRCKIKPELSFNLFQLVD